MEPRETLESKYPSNSKEKKKEKKPVIKGKVLRQKKSLGKKFSETFLEDDTKTVGSYIFYDILIPAFKAMISDMVGGGVEMLLFGDARARRASHNMRRDGTRSSVNYGVYSRDGGQPTRQTREFNKTNRARHEFDEIILESRGEAEMVLSNLVDLVVDYGQATVADLYDMVDIESTFTDQKYGWMDLSGAGVIRSRRGYLLNLPRTQVLD